MMHKIAGGSVGDSPRKEARRWREYGMDMVIDAELASGCIGAPDNLGCVYPATKYKWGANTLRVA